MQRKTEETLKLLNGLSLEQRQLFQTLMNDNERMTKEMRQMWSTVQLQMALPPQVLLQNPVTLLDACGKVSAFHLDFTNSTAAFIAVLKVRFKQEGVGSVGIQMLENFEFVLQD